MAPKRLAKEALSDNPEVSWPRTAVAAGLGRGFLSGPHLAAYMKHHEMPVDKKALQRLHGRRLWLSRMERVPVEHRPTASGLAPEGLVALARAFDHGFRAPEEAQDRLLLFLGALPVASATLARLQEHYAACRAFRLNFDGTAAPTLLDLFKDDRVPKTWRADGVVDNVLIDCNRLLYTWPALMPPGWNSHNAARDALRLWESCAEVVARLHEDLENEGSLTADERAKLRCYAVVEEGVLRLNFVAYVVFVNQLPGPLAKTLSLRSSFLDAFAEIGSQQARAVLVSKLQRAACDPAAAQLRAEVGEEHARSVAEDGPVAKRRREDLAAALAERDAERERRWELVLEERERRWELVLEEHDQRWQLKVAAREKHYAAHMEALETRFLAREERYAAQVEALETRLLAAVSAQGEQQSLRVLFSMQAALRPLLDIPKVLQALPANLALTLRGAVRDVVEAAVTNVDSLFVRTLRAATKGPAKRASLDSARFPPQDRATDVQNTLEALSLAVVAHELCPAMTYPGWKSVRSAFGKAALRRRLERHALGPDDPLYVAQPRLWTFVGSTVEGGGARLLFLQSEKPLLREVWMAQRPCGDSLHARALVRSRELPHEPWPQHASELEPATAEVFGKAEDCE